MLESGEDMKRLVGVAANREIVHHFVRNLAFGIDKEQASQSDAPLSKHAVIRGNFLILVGEERVINLAKAAFFAGGIDPGEVGVVAVHGTTDDLGIQLREIIGSVGKINNFRRTDKREVKRIEEQNRPLSRLDVFCERNITELVTNHSFPFEIRGNFLN